MTREERLALNWYLLEGDLQNKYAAVNARLNTHAVERAVQNPESMFPSMQSTHEVIIQSEAVAYAVVLDLVHTAMRELGLPYD